MEKRNSAQQHTFKSKISFYFSYLKIRNNSTSKVDLFDDYKTSNNISWNSRPFQRYKMEPWLILNNFLYDGTSFYFVNL